MNLIRLSVAVLLTASILVGCGASHGVKKGVIGAVAGAAVGAAIGHTKGDAAKGAVIGGAAGGAVGAAIGIYMDKQAKEMEAIEGAEVKRVDDKLDITFDSGILFATNSSELKDEAKESIKKLAEILQKYPETNVKVMGHTDSDGAEAYNQTLSEKRANAVAVYAESLGVAVSRVTVIGYGETKPVADNTTAEGKAANRRVEVELEVTEEFKKKAAEEAAKEEK